MDAKYSSSNPSSPSISDGASDVKAFVHVITIPLILPFLCFLFVLDDTSSIVQL